MKEYLDFLSKTFLFKNISPFELESIIADVKCEIIEYYKNDIVCSPDVLMRRVGFIITGECEVLQHCSDGRSARLRSLCVGDSFGILGIFLPAAEYPTTIKVLKNARILYISSDSMSVLLDKDTRISRNIIDFFATRIYFLNTRISTFSSGSVEQKLASYLIYCYRKFGADCFAFNKVQASREIGVGRASLYRAISSFSDRGLIDFDNKSLQILNIDEIERISK